MTEMTMAAPAGKHRAPGYATTIAALLVVLALLLGLMTECDKGDDGSDYHPQSGNNAWW